MHGGPVLAVSLAFISGVAIGAWLPQEPAAWGWAAAAAIAVWAFLFASGVLAVGSRIGLASFLFVGIFRLQADLVPLYAGVDNLAEGDAVAHGRIARPAELRDGEMVLHLEDARLRRDGATLRLDLPLQIIVPGAGEGYSVGDLVTVRGKVRLIRGDRNLGWFPGPIATRGNRLRRAWSQPRQPGPGAKDGTAAAARMPPCSGGVPLRMPSGKRTPGRPGRSSTR